MRGNSASARPRTKCDFTHVGALHSAGNEVAFAVDKLIVKRITLRFANLLQNNLLGSLGGDAAEASGGIVDLHHDDIVKLRLGIEESCSIECNFSRFAENVIHHFFFDEDFGAPGDGINLRFNRLGRAGARVLAIGRYQGALQGLQHDIRRQRAHLRNLIKGNLQFV